MRLIQNKPLLSITFLCLTASFVAKLIRIVRSFRGHFPSWVAPKFVLLTILRCSVFHVERLLALVLGTGRFEPFLLHTLPLHFELILPRRVNLLALALVFDRVD